jgi:ABC-2 type transport system ATP-binding protein
MAAIEVRGLVKEYPGARALDGVDVTVERGEIVGLLGPNGAGKTTLLRTLAGTLAPTEGTAAIEGRDVVTESLEVRRRVGYLPENAPLYPEMTPRQYLRFMAAVRRIHVDDDLHRTVERCGIARVLDRPIGHLSKGYRQRVGLAQAILHWPATLLLDEPTSGLDPNQIAEIRDLIREIGRERTVILSSHILSEVEATCDRVLIIDGGRIVGEGTPEALAADTGEEHTVHLELAGTPATQAVAALEGIEGVASVEVLDDAIVTLVADRDVRADVFGAAVARGWTLLELRSERRSLESVYRALVSASPDFARDDEDEDEPDEEPSEA